MNVVLKREEKDDNSGGLANNDDSLSFVRRHRTSTTGAFLPHTHLYDTEEQQQGDKQNNGSSSSIVATTTSHFRFTKRGKLWKTTKEHYIRNDLGYGCCYTNRNTSSSSTPSTGDVQTIHTMVELDSFLVTNNDTLGKSIIICDTNVLIHNMDVLEANSSNKAFPNIVIPQTSLEECRNHQSRSNYQRLIQFIKSNGGSNSSATDGSTIKQTRSRCVLFFPDLHHVETQVSSQDRITLLQRKKELLLADQPIKDEAVVALSDNDLNDLRIRKVSNYFASKLGTKDSRSGNRNNQVILLTDDKQCRELSIMEQTEHHWNYEARSVRDHIQTLIDDNNKEDDKDIKSLMSLMDMVAAHSMKLIHNDKDTRQTKQNKIWFEPHLSSSDISLGIKSLKLYKGIFRCSDRSSYQKGYVTVRGYDDGSTIAVTIDGLTNINRALDGDLVAIQLCSMDQWIQSSSGTSTSGSQSNNNIGGEGATTTTSTTTAAEPTIGEMDNVMEEIHVPTDKVQTVMKPTGKVVGIMKRNIRSIFCGSIYSSSSSTTKTKGRGREQPSSVEEERRLIAEEYEQSNSNDDENETYTVNTCVFFAVDGRVPPILLRTSQRSDLMNKRVLVSIDSWPIDSPYPLGHYIRTLGDAGSKDVETEVVLHEYNIPCEPFSAQVLACLPPADYKISLDDDDNGAGSGSGPQRMDLRHLPVLSIDPPGCKDIDDALHCISLPNSPNYQVGVHIADVTHYVKAGTPIDLEASNRSTSTYLVNKRLDMLPSLLTTDLCSLKGNVDRFAFSVLWEVTPEGDIVDVSFQKTIIHSIGALTYQEAQGLIDADEITLKKQSKDDKDILIKADAVKRLNSLAKIFRQRRLDAGALTLASPEVKFVLDDESLNPTDVTAYPMYEANALVEEFMLLANVTVAKKILRHYPTLSILRRHPAPNRTMFDSLIKKAKLKGFDITIDDSKTLADSLDAAVIPEDPFFNKLLRILSTRCMSPAQYFCSGEYKPSEWHHYGLAAPVYTHFTSPIRRYADVCVHRLLSAALGVEPLPPRLSSKSVLHDLSSNMNRRHRAAQLAGRSSVHLHTVLFFASGGGGGSGNSVDSSTTTQDVDHGDEKKTNHQFVEDAYVLDVESSNNNSNNDDDTEAGGATNNYTIPTITVFVPRYGIEGKIRLDGTTKVGKEIDTNNDETTSLFTWTCNLNDFSVLLTKQTTKQTKVTTKATGKEADVDHDDHDKATAATNENKVIVLRKIQVFDKVRVIIWVRSLADYQKELVLELVQDEASSGSDSPTTTKKRQRADNTTSGDSNNNNDDNDTTMKSPSSIGSSSSKKKKKKRKK